MEFEVEKISPEKAIEILKKDGLEVTWMNRPIKAIHNVTRMSAYVNIGVRYNASKVNDNIVAEIRKYVRPLPKLQLYKEVIVSVFKAKTHLQRNDVQQLNSQLDEVNKRLSKARDLLLAGDIEADDYRLI